MSIFKVITICGSMRFYDAMLLAAQDLSKNGYIVLMPFCVFAPDEQQGADKEMLDRMHFAKIDMSSEICVVTDTDGYTGTSTKNEMAYAMQQQKNVVVYEYRQTESCWELVGTLNQM